MDQSNIRREHKVRTVHWIDALSEFGRIGVMLLWAPLHCKLPTEDLGATNNAAAQRSVDHTFICLRPK